MRSKILSLAAIAAALCVLWPAGATARSPYRAKVLKGHENFVFRLCTDAKGARVVSVAQDATVRLWSVRSGRALAVVKAGDAEDFGVVALAPGGDRLAVAVEETIRIYDYDKKKRRLTPGKELSGHKGEISGLSFATDNVTLLSSAEDGARVWSAETGNSLHELVKGKKAFDAQVSPADGTLAVAAADGVHLFKRGSHEAIVKGGPADTRRLAWLPDGSALAARTAEGKVLVLEAKKLAVRWSQGGFANETALAVVKGGTQVVAATNDRQFKALDTTTGKLKWFLKGPSTVAYMAGRNALLATASSGESDNRIWIWRVR